MFTKYLRLLKPGCKTLRTRVFLKLENKQKAVDIDAVFFWEKTSGYLPSPRSTSSRNVSCSRQVSPFSWCDSFLHKDLHDCVGLSVRSFQCHLDAVILLEHKLNLRLSNRRFL